MGSLDIITAEKIINNWNDCLINYNNNVVNNFSNILSEFQECLKTHEMDDKENSFDFNLFQLFSPGEIMHSKILAFFLDPKSTHGQRDLFLKIFLEKLDVPNYENGNWVVTKEKGGIDIIIKRNHPQSVIIIENKSNSAPDQKNQLYRYWKSEIYSPNFKKIDIGKPDIYENEVYKNHFQILYLPPNNEKKISSHSLERPEDENDPTLPKILPIKIKFLSFEDFIVNWLDQSLTHILNPTIQEFTLQYCQYWKHKK
jgi:hypothetical protein